MNKNIKILFPLEPDDQHATETLWGTRCNETTAILENSPFYARGVSFKDCVQWELKEGIPTFVSVVKSGGHSTYWIIPAQFLTVVQKRLKELEELHCTYETTDEKYTRIALDVPPHANLERVYAKLEDGESLGDWYFEEGNCPN